MHLWYTQVCVCVSLLRISRYHVHTNNVLKYVYKLHGVACVAGGLTRAKLHQGWITQAES